MIDNLESWNKKELGFINRILSFEWGTNLENKEESKKIDFLIYTIIEKNSRYISLGLIQKDAIDCFTKEFCDGWENKLISQIINDILQKHANIKADIIESKTKLSFTNPLNWTPIRALLYLMPMFTSKKGDNCCFFYSTSNNEWFIKSLNTFLEKENPDPETFIKQVPDQSKESKRKGERVATISNIKEYYFPAENNNLLVQLQNNTFGFSLNEYNIKTKTLNSNNINNNVEDSIKLLGRNSALVENFDSSYKNCFYISGINGEEIEKNTAIFEYVKNNKIFIIVCGFNQRELGDKVVLDLSSRFDLLDDPMQEYSGEAIITTIKHIFTKDSYIQRIELFKSGLENFEEKIAL